MIDCEFDTLILSLVLIWIFYVFNFILQLSNFKIIYETITLEEVKNILSEEKIKWREVNKSHLIGYDLDDNIGVEIIRDINTNSIIVKLEKDR